MSATESAPAGTGRTANDDRGDNASRRRAAVVGVVLLVAGLGAWSWLTTPRLEGGGLAGVTSSDQEFVLARGFHGTVFVVPAHGPGDSTIAFEVRNAGPLAVELVEVWPNEDIPSCFWQPHERWFQDDPRHRGVLDDRARPAEGAVIAPGGSATVWVTGAFAGLTSCIRGVLVTHDDVEVIVRIGGRTSTTRVPLGYTFGYSDDPEMLRSSYDVQVLPPTDPSDGD